MATLQPGEHARMYALGKVARGGATRGGYVDGRVYINLAGTYHVGFGRTESHVGTLISSLSITDALDEQPNSCTFRVNAAVVPTGTRVRVTLGSKNRTDALFSGFATTVEQLYVGDRPANIQSNVTCVDDGWLLGFVLVTASYRSLPADVVAWSLVGSFAAQHGFTAAFVQPGLPIVDEITFTNERFPECLTRLARRIGANWYCDGAKAIHFYFAEPQGNGDPVPLTPTHTSLAHFNYRTERTQALARVYVEGRGTRLLSPVAPGETIIPIEAMDMFEPAADVFLKVARSGASGGAQHWDFTGVVRGGAGALVGEGIGPSAAMTATPVAGGGIEAGKHDYAVTYITAAGETLPSPRATVILGAVADPTVSPINFMNTPMGTPYMAGMYQFGEQVSVGYAYSTAATTAEARNERTLVRAIGYTIAAVSNNDPLNPTKSAPVYASFPTTKDKRVKWIVTYFWAQSRNAWGPYHVIANNPDAVEGTFYGEYFTVYTDSSGLPATNTTSLNRVNLSAIPIGPTAVIGKRIYRSAADQSLLKMLADVPPAQTTYSDSTSDAALGVNAPAGDTSGLQQPAGQVVAGASTIPVANTVGFLPTGGWAVIGNGEQVVRYTGTSAKSLIGIPGAQAIGGVHAAIAYNSTITAAHLLTGIPASGPRSVSGGLSEGDEVYLVVQVDDANVKNALAAMGAGTGVREDWVQDRRLSVTEARARGEATLATRPLDTTSISYTCRDLRTASGKNISVNLPAPTNVVGQFKIQNVTINNFRPYANQYPTFTVEASSQRFSFEEWLRVMRTKQ